MAYLTTEKMFTEIKETKILSLKRLDPCSRYYGHHDSYSYLQNSFNSSLDGHILGIFFLYFRLFNAVNNWLNLNPGPLVVLTYYWKYLLCQLPHKTHANLYNVFTAKAIDFVNYLIKIPFIPVASDERNFSKIFFSLFYLISMQSNNICHFAPSLSLRTSL